MPSLTDLFANGIVATAKLVKHKGIELACIHLAGFIQHGLVRQNSHNLAQQMVILYCLMRYEPVRFNEMKRYLGDITDKTLSSNLKELEHDQLILRKEYPQIPPKVEYSLSERGRSLMKVLDQLCIWGTENRLPTE